MTQGETDKAIAAYAQAVELAPSLAPARVNLGAQLLQSGRLRDAEAVRDVVQNLLILTLPAAASSTGAAAPHSQKAACGLLRAASHGGICLIVALCVNIIGGFESVGLYGRYAAGVPLALLFVVTAQYDVERSHPVVPGKMHASHIRKPHMCISIDVKQVLI